MLRPRLCRFDALGLDDTSDCDGHGTHTAGVAAGTQYGVAPQAMVHPVRVFNCSRHEDADNVASAMIAGMQWIQQTATFHYPGEPAVVVRQFFCSSQPLTNVVGWDLTDVALSLTQVSSLAMPYDLALCEAVESLLGAGFSFVAASGDDSEDVSGFAPANCSPDVVVVVRVCVRDSLVAYPVTFLRSPTLSVSRNITYSAVSAASNTHTPTSHTGGHRPARPTRSGRQLRLHGDALCARRERDRRHRRARGPQHDAVAARALYGHHGPQHCAGHYFRLLQLCCAGCGGRCAVPAGECVCVADGAM
jgi:hypothetical protein